MVPLFGKFSATAQERLYVALQNRGSLKAVSVTQQFNRTCLRTGETTLRLTPDALLPFAQFECMGT